MRGVYIRRSWLRFATGLLALALIAAIWKSGYRFSEKIMLQQ
jgi:hypothetical protein